jgi:hypothetical protein
MFQEILPLVAELRPKGAIADQILGLGFDHVEVEA